MQQTDIPPLFPIPFANAAGSSYIRAIPTAHQAPTSSDAPASLTDGFQPVNFQPLSAGGIPPNGADFNGLFNQITAVLRWKQAGGPALHDATFSAAIGGYPKGAQLASVTTPGIIWVSTVDNNTTDPDSGGAAGWVSVAASAGGHDANGATLPGGLMLKWGVVSVVGGEGDYTFTFPSAFPNHCYAVIPQILNPSGSTSAGFDMWLQLQSYNVNGFTAVYQSTGGNTGYGVSYLAIGD
jgi:hypothetical protein